MTADRDWERELAKIDRLMGDDTAPDSTPAPTKPDAVAPKSERKAVAAPAAAESKSVAKKPRPLRTWPMAIAGTVGAIALFIWPYGTDCGMVLYVYIVGALAVLGASLFTMRAAWHRHRGAAMILGILLMLVALGLLAATILPRTGYAVVTLPWRCTP